MRIAIVDDDEKDYIHTRDTIISTFVKKGLPTPEVIIYTSGNSFLERCEIASCDLIVLDILMGKPDGIDVAREIRKQNKDVNIAFCSSSNEYAFQSYQTGACFYLRKPATEEALLEMIERLTASTPAFSIPQNILLPDHQTLSVGDFIFSQYENHQVMLYRKSDPLPLRCWISQGEFVQLLAAFPFLILCNKGNVINLNEVTAFDKSSFTMSNGEVIPVSRRKQKETEATYHEFLFHKTRDEM